MHALLIEREIRSNSKAGYFTFKPKEISLLTCFFEVFYVE